MCLPCRLPLGVPSQLFLTALDTTTSLILKPHCTAAVGASVEREAGYILLGALCYSLAPDLLAVSAGSCAAMLAWG